MSVDSRLKTENKRKFFSLLNIVQPKVILGNYRLEKTIGEGTFGKVKLAIHIPTQEKVIYKVKE